MDMVIFYAFIFIFGLIIGSFLNVCIYRIPEGKSVIWPPSQCTSCGEGLKYYDLIPVFSFIYLRGRCRYCKEKISIRYLLIELLTAVVFLLLFCKYFLTVDFVAYSFLMSVLIVVFFIDLEHRIIPDELVFVGIIGGIVVFVYNIFMTMNIYGDNNWWNPLLGGLSSSAVLFLVAIIGMLIYRNGDAMGMGDVKIFVPIGLFLGWRMSLFSLLISIFAGGIIGLFLIVTGLKKRKDVIPFGPFIVLAVFITIMWGWDIVGWYILNTGL